MIIDAFERQAGFCQMLGSPFTAEVLGNIATDLQTDKVFLPIFAGWRLEPQDAVLALRLAGGLNYLALSGRDFRLNEVYPPLPREVASDTLKDALLGAGEKHKDFLRGFIKTPVQTNEVGRSTCLMPGFVEISKRTGLPLRLLEIGTSGGLNLLWDHYSYEFGSTGIGDPQSAVLLTADWQGDLPPLSVFPTVVSRMGCDINPLDLSKEEVFFRALSYIWPDQIERVRQFKNASQLLRNCNTHIDKEDAVNWLERQLTKKVCGATTVLFHSIMWQYMPDESKSDCLRIIKQAGHAATDDSPFAYLTMEPGEGDIPELALTVWPGGRRQVLAHCHPHGTHIKWLAN